MTVTSHTVLRLHRDEHNAELKTKLYRMLECTYDFPELIDLLSSKEFCNEMDAFCHKKRQSKLAILVAVYKHGEYSVDV